VRRTIKLGTRSYEIEVPRRTLIEQFETDVYSTRREEAIERVDYRRMFTQYRPGMKVGVIIDLPLEDPFTYTTVDNALSTLHSLGAYDNEIVLFFTSRVDPKTIPPIYAYRYETIVARDLERARREDYVTLSTLENMIKVEVYKAFERDVSKGSESGLNAIYVISDSFIDGIYGIRTPIMAILDFLSVTSFASLMRARAELGLQDFIKTVSSRMIMLPPFRYVYGGISLLKDFTGEVFEVTIGNSRAIHNNVIEKYLKSYGYAIPEKYDVIILGLTEGTFEALHRALTFARPIMKQNTVVILCSDSWSIKEEHENLVLEYLSERRGSVLTEDDVRAYEIAKFIAERTIMLVGRGHMKLFEIFQSIQDAVDIALEKVLSTEPRPRVLVLSYADYLIPANLV